MHLRIAALAAALTLAVGFGGVSVPLTAQAGQPRRDARRATAPQRIDDEYTKLIKQHLQDPRISTELVDHLPASDTVPTPLKFFGRAVGTPGELTYAKDIYRYYEAMAMAEPTGAKFWEVDTTVEGRGIVLLACEEVVQV